jgi:hypothetical protein
MNDATQTETTDTGRNAQGNRTAVSALSLVAANLDAKGDGRSLALGRTLREIAGFLSPETEARVMAAGFNVVSGLYQGSTQPEHKAREATCAELAALIYDTGIGLQGAHEREQAAAWWSIARGLDQRVQGAPPEAIGRYAAMGFTWTREARALDVAAKAGGITEEARRAVRGEVGQ